MAPVSSDTTLIVTDCVQDPDENMQEVIPRLWLGDYASSCDVDALQRHGIKYVVSALRFKPAVIQGIVFQHIPIDDSPDADILAHLPTCINFIDKALESGAGVLVHCQAGVSRSATIVAAYIMHTKQVESGTALALIQSARPQACPSDTFLYQLKLFYDVSFKVSKQDKQTRRFYLERTVEEVMNGDGSAPEMTMMPSWPGTPSGSTPATPSTERPKRRIRCKMCRRELATREHMLDHNVGALTRPVTPGLTDVDPMTSLSRPSSRPPSRTPSRRSSSTAADAAALPTKMALTQINTGDSGVGAAGAQVKRRGSSGVVSSPSPLSHEMPIPTEGVSAAPPLSTPTIPEEGAPSSTGAAHPGASLPPLRKPSLRRISNALGSASDTVVPRLTQLTSMTPVRSNTLPSSDDSAVSEEDDPPLPLLSASALNSHLPPMLAALRNPVPHLQAPAAGTLGKRRTSLSALQPLSKISASDEAQPALPQPPALAMRTSSAGSTAASAPSYFSPPILANPNCSGYFLEPMKWMEPFLADGELGGKIVCPNKKCGAKLGNYDWAGVRCSCKEWVVPGFCIHKSKVDEDL